MILNSWIFECDFEPKFRTFEQKLWFVPTLNSFCDFVTNFGTFEHNLWFCEEYFVKISAIRNSWIFECDFGPEFRTFEQKLWFVPTLNSFCDFVTKFGTFEHNLWFCEDYLKNFSDLQYLIPLNTFLWILNGNIDLDRLYYSEQLHFGS